MRESVDETIASSAVGADAADRRTFIVAGLVVALTQLGFFITSAALPLYLRDLGAAEGRIGLEVGAGNLVAVFITFALGPALNRFGPRPFIILGGVLYLTAALAMLAIRAEVPVTLFRVLQGAGAAAIMPSASMLVISLYPARPATALGLMSSLNSLALASGPPLGLALYAAHGASALFIPAAFAAAFGLLATRLLPGGRPVHRARGFGFDRAWIPLLMMIALGMIHFGGILAYLSLHLREVHGPNAGIFFAADSLGVLLLRAPTGMLIDRVGSRWPKILGTISIFVGVASLGLMPSPLTLIVAGSGTGIGAGMLISGVMADLARMSGAANRGTALSLGTACFSGAFFVGGTLSGLLIGPGGFGAVVLLGTLATLAALPFALVSRPVSPETSAT